MIDLPYSLVIEATDEPDYFGFYSPDLEGFSGIGHSVEDCLYQARWGMKEHVEILAEQGLPVPRAMRPRPCSSRICNEQLLPENHRPLVGRPLGAARNRRIRPQSGVRWIDYRQPLETCDRTEILIGANEVIKK
jgi:predicted RNase H-like HicB family nuclease